MEVNHIPYEHFEARGFPLLIDVRRPGIVRVAMKYVRRVICLEITQADFDYLHPDEFADMLRFMQDTLRSLEAKNGQGFGDEVWRSDRLQRPA